MKILWYAWWKQNKTLLHFNFHGTQKQILHISNILRKSISYTFCGNIYIRDYIKYGLKHIRCKNSFHFFRIIKSVKQTDRENAKQTSLNCYRTGLRNCIRAWKLVVSAKPYNTQKLHESHLCEFLWGFKAEEIKRIL